jgi:hypothetical protein
MTFDAADLALIEIDESATAREKALVEALREALREADEGSAVCALEDCQQEATRALNSLARAAYHLDFDGLPDASADALKEVRNALERITWR